MPKNHSVLRLVNTACTIALAFTPALLHADSFTQTNLVSDIQGLANNTDPNLKNPWGVSFSATSPFWTSDQGTGLATLYNGAGAPQGLVVSVPGSTTSLSTRLISDAWAPNTRSASSPSAASSTR